MSEMSAVYLNYPYNHIPLERTYNYEPIPNELESKFHKRILGIEACLWTEFVKNKKTLEWQAFPRLIAIAETGWIPKNKKNFKYWIKYFWIYLVELISYKLADIIILTNPIDIEFIVKTFKLKKKNIKDVQLVYVQSVENKMIPISITASGSILARDRMEIYTKNFNEKVQAG